MHEYSIACEIFEQVIAAARAHGASEVRSVTLEMGRLTHTNPEQLSFCFGALAEGSIAEGAEFIVEMIPPSLECECGYAGTVDEARDGEQDELLSEMLEDIAALKCPACGKNARITGGQELVIKSIDIETEPEK